MKKRFIEKNDIEKKFKNEKIEGKKLNYLMGGDEDGGQGGTGDWI